MKRSRWKGGACIGLRGDYSGGAARGRSAPSACGEDLAGRGGYVIEQSLSGDTWDLNRRFLGHRLNLQPLGFQHG